ncbi:two-component sensor histidine kinase (plasmid) [Azospirillum sp. B510]|uniref:sensor histidine kinase n=1 Tax=Azospirillum sp. (strain B510) TaxID=137722 RepID=UPI0001C4CB32|nr:ATP-binding protein [Azospirillum sp. B510]BAI75337.1 two-component sensor histidine kinase [Azospirillum sp. B510]
MPRLPTLRLPSIRMPSFRNGVLAIAALALAGVWVGYAVMASSMLESQMREAIVNAQTTARAYESSTSRTLHDVDTTLRSFAERYAEGGLPRARRIIDDGLYDSSLIHHFSVFGPDGLQRFRSEGNGPPDTLEGSGLTAYHQGEGRSLMKVGPPVTGSAARRPLLRVSRRLEDAAGDFAGVVVANVDPDYLSDFYRQADVGRNGVVTLVGLDRIIRARGSKDGKDAVGLDSTRSNLWTAVRQSLTGVFWQDSIADGMRRAYAYRPVEGYPLILVVGIAVKDIDAEVAGFRGQMRIIAGLFSVSVLLVAGFLLVQHRNAERLAAALAVNRDFLARVSHEFRTPLNAIIGFSEIIKDQMFGPDAGPRYADYARDIHTSGQHLLTLIDDILDLSRLQAGKFALLMEDVDPVAAAEWAIRIVTPQAEQKSIHLEIKRPPSPTLVRADERALKQMLLNLLSNALKFTPENGRVLVSVGRGTHGRCIVRITDTGIGMTAEELRQASVPFGQTAALVAHPGRGTGLGLPIVKSLIEAHGGSLRIDSRPGQGSQITLEFTA